MSVVFNCPLAGRETMPSVLLKPSLPDDIIDSTEVEWLRRAGFSIARFHKDPKRSVIYAEDRPPDHVVVEHPRKIRDRLAHSYPEHDQPLWAAAMIQELDYHLQECPRLSRIVIERSDILYTFVAPILQTMVRKRTHSAFSGAHTLHLVTYTPSGGSVIEIDHLQMVECDLDQGVMCKRLLAHFVSIGEAARQQADGELDISALRQLFRQAKPLVRDLM